MFWDDLCKALKQWREQGDRPILTMDANNNILNGKYTKSKRLVAEGLDMKNGTHSCYIMNPNKHS